MAHLLVLSAIIQAGITIVFRDLWVAYGYLAKGVGVALKEKGRDPSRLRLLIIAVRRRQVPDPTVNLAERPAPPQAVNSGRESKSDYMSKLMIRLKDQFRLVILDSLSFICWP